MTMLHHRMRGGKGKRAYYCRLMGLAFQPGAFGGRVNRAVRRDNSCKPSNPQTSSSILHSSHSMYSCWYVNSAIAIMSCSEDVTWREDAFLVVVACSSPVVTFSLRWRTPKMPRGFKICHAAIPSSSRSKIVNICARIAMRTPTDEDWLSSISGQPWKAPWRIPSALER